MTPSTVPSSWDRYWEGALDAAPCASESGNHPETSRFWQELFRKVKAEFATPKLIDIASGRGAVVADASKVFIEGLPETASLDTSPAALAIIRKRFPSVRCFVGDARAMPFRPASFDVATSQFGVEYAGIDAVREMARLVAPGGYLALVVHHEEGGIYLDSRASIDAVERLIASEFVARATEMFRAGFAACRGADLKIYEAAVEELRPSFHGLEGIMSDHGKHVAGDTILRLFSDVSRINDRIQYHDPVEVLDWLDRIQSELPLYLGRLTSMCDSAMNEESLGRVGEYLGNNNFSVQRLAPLYPAGEPLPLAWALIAKKNSVG